MDVSEFDVWWAIERRAREKAKRGRLTTYFDGQPEQITAQKLLLEAMDAVYIAMPVVDGKYEILYENSRSGNKETNSLRMKAAAKYGRMALENKKADKKTVPMSSNCCIFFTIVLMYNNN